MDQRSKLTFFQELISCCHNLYYWNYDRDMRLLYSNCPEETLVNDLFILSEQTQVLLDYAQIHRKPVILTTAINLIWVAIPEKEDGTLIRFHTLGPFFIDGSSLKQVETEI